MFENACINQSYNIHYIYIYIPEYKQIEMLIGSLFICDM